MLSKKIIDRTVVNETLEDIHFDCIEKKISETKDQSEEDIKKEELIDKLEDSSSFSNTHAIIEQMSVIKEWTEDQNINCLKLHLKTIR